MSVQNAAAIKPILPVEVVRDEDGWFTHPQYFTEPEWDDVDNFTREEFDNYCAERGIEAAITSLEGDDDDAHQRYCDEGQAECSGWEPSRPAGDGWFVLSIHDTEDGPICVWGRSLLSAAQPAAPLCDHQWTDDGQYLLICTECGAQEDHDPKWRDMATAPRDGTMLRLLVEFTDHSTEDETTAPTIGANSFDNDGEDRWQFAGWCWTHDHFTEGKGEPIGWLPMLDEPRRTDADGVKSDE